MRSIRRLASLAVLFLLVACGGSTPPPSVLSFTADPATVRSGEASTLRWSVRDAETLTIDVGVGDVSGNVQAVVLPTTTTTYTLTASNRAGSDAAQATVSVDASIDVEGYVIGLDGRPAPGVEVFLDRGTVGHTEADGRFHATGVDVPYQAMLVHPSEPISVTYVGLTLSEPVLVLSGAPTAAAHTASIYGTVSAGTGFPQPAGYATGVSFGSSALRVSKQVDGATGAFQFVGLPWFGADAEGALHALQWQTGVDGLPSAYTGHGYRPLTLRSTILAYLTQDMALLPIGTGTVSGSVQLPANYVLASRSLSVVFDEGGWITTTSENLPGSGFSYLTPAVDGARMVVGVGAFAPGGGLSFATRADLPATRTGVDVTLPSVAALVSPPDGAAGIGDDTAFTWSAEASAVVVVFTRPAGRSVVLVTHASEIRLRDLLGLGTGLAPGTLHRWQVFRLPTYPTVDAAVTQPDAFLDSWPLNAFFTPSRDGAWAASVQREMTTAP